MRLRHSTTHPHSFSRIPIFILAVLWFFLISTPAYADTPVTLFQSFAGNINITGTGGTLRTQADPNSCTVTNTGSMTLSGLPTGSTVMRAYLYWAGSGGDPVGGSPADYAITFNGLPVTADRTYTAFYNTTTMGYGVLYFFGGVRDVTASVTGNGVYTFADLAVQNANVGGGGQYCTAGAVLSAFSLVVVYSDPNETLHVVNVWEGFQSYRGSSITLTPTNFIVPTPAPTAALSSRILILTWEGDNGNSGTLGGFSENLTFCSPAPCAGAAISDAYNPVNNQFNSTIDMPPSGPYSGINTTWGVDLDMYDITGSVPAGAASAQSVYSSGGDLVILMNQTMSLPNVPVADLAITKMHTDNFYVGSNGIYTLSVVNNGPNPATGTITVTDTLPAGLTYLSATGTGWTCGAVGQVVTCTRPGPLANGASTPDIDVTVAVGAAAAPSVTNTATVASGAFDNVASNSTANDVTTVVTPGIGNKPLYLYSGPTYTISRTAPSGTPATVTVGPGANRVWSQLPAAQGNMTLDPSVSATVPVYLQAARSGSAGNISLTVRLQCSSGGTILTQTANCAAALEPATSQCIYNLPLTAPLTCAAGNSWRLTILNNSGTRTLYVHPVSGGNSSRVILPSTTVIDVNSVAAYSAPYPSTSTTTTYIAGSTVYLRGVVSDPFGSFDITSASITIRDSSNALLVNAGAMTQVNDSGTLTKTYEYVYTVPVTGPSGTWTANVNAREGAEGTVSDFGVGAFSVALPPSITVVKSALIESDPVNGATNPKAIPGAVLVYSITVANSGAGTADGSSIVITDAVPANTTLSVDTGAGNPVAFSCSTVPACGLTWNYATAVSYSSQAGGGAPFNYTPGTSGYDPLVTGIRINPSGVLNGSGASFTVQFRVMVNY